MTGVWDFPNIDELRDFIHRGIREARLELAEEFGGDRAEMLRRLELERIIIVDEWGRGTAEVGGDTLDVFLFFSIEGIDREHILPAFDPATRAVVQRFNTIINRGDIDIPEQVMEWFPRFDPEPVAMSRFTDQVNLSLGRREGNTVFDLTRMEAIRFVEPVELEGIEEGTRPVPTQALPRIPLEELREVEEEPEEVIEEVEPEPEPEPEPEILPAEERIREYIDEFGEDGVLDIPAGKPTKRVEQRDLFDFEIWMGLPGQILDELEEHARIDQIHNGVGWSVQIGRFGNQDPPATFPRTSSYVRNYLINRGPQYILQLYNDMVVYSGFISAFYNSELRPGSYRSFREFIYRLRQINERGGPQLIEMLSQQQAASRGLEIIPDHPTIDGEKAPWLERRHYLDIVEENADHDAWDNPTEYLYSEFVETEEVEG